MDTIKKRLETELKEAEQEKQQLDARLENKPDFGPGEGATLVTSWEMTLARKQEVTTRIKALQEALDRVQNGTYGYCQDCGTQINPERLEILPTTRRCTTCAQQQGSSQNKSLNSLPR